MARAEFLIVGLSPLLCNSPQSMFAAAGAKAAKGKQIPTPAEEAELGTYRNEDGSFMFPVIGPRNALLVASKNYKAKGKRGSVFGDLAHIQPETEYAAILNGDGGPAKSYTKDTRRVVVQRNGVLRTRPRFENWSLRFGLLYDSELIKDPETLRVIMDDAGNRIGIGDYRPAKWGWFGRFKVKELLT